MPASMILRLARVMRCATVVSGTRKARAIWAVVRLLAGLALGLAKHWFTGLPVVRKAVRTAVVRGVAEGVAYALARLVSHLGA